MEISGQCEPRFEGVRREFERNFRERGEVGASVCVSLGGETVVDFWGGLARADTQTPWREDTVSVVFSATKGATALCVHMLVSRGEVDLDAPVAEYWPEFAHAGKDRIPVRMLLNHQAGVPAVRDELPAGCFTDWDLMTEALAREAPFWEPGTRNGYHALAMGWLLGELVRRVSGKSLGTFFRDEVAAPLGLDFWIGLPAEHEPRVAQMIAADIDFDDVLFKSMMDPTSFAFLAIVNCGGYMSTEPQYDSRAAHAAEIGAAGGISNARGLAGMYAPLANGGASGTLELVNAETLAGMSAVSSATGRDAVLVIPTRFSLGYMKSMDNRRQPKGAQSSAIFPESAFGHVGAGGSLGLADPGCGMSFGYTMNKMGPGILLTERGQSLLDACYAALAEG